MNLKTTIALTLLAASGIGVWIWLDRHKPAPPTTATTQEFLQKKLTADKLKRIEVLRERPLEMPLLGASAIGLMALPIGPSAMGASFCPRVQTLCVLEKTGTEWHLAGNWAVRPQETEQWLAVLTKLDTRFGPEPLNEENKPAFYGLAEDALIVRVLVDGEWHTLRFGRPVGETNQYTLETYVRLDETPEVLRLGPGVLAALDRSEKYFQRPRLFEVERIAKEDNAKERIDQLDASAVVVESAFEHPLVHAVTYVPGLHFVFLLQSAPVKFTVAKKDKEWILRDNSIKIGTDWTPLSSEDRLEPGKRTAFLSAFNDLWAETFVDQRDKSLEDFGLKTPAYSLTVSQSKGAPIKLLIGNACDAPSDDSKIPPPNPLGKPSDGPFRYAKLEGSNHIFRIKTAKLGDITTSAAALRDPQLARFATSDVQRVEIQHDGQEMVLSKIKQPGKTYWMIDKPTREEAETKEIEEVLTELAGLRAQNRDILDRTDLKSVGLDKPHTLIKLTVLDTSANAEGNEKTREIVFRLGSKATDKSKLYAMVDAWPRVNQINADLLKLVQRPAVAYRKRRLLDIVADDIQKIDVQRGDEKFAFQKNASGWKMTAPVLTDVDSTKLDELAIDLSKLQSAAFVSEQANAETLDKTYGLAKPYLTVTLHYNRFLNKGPQTLALGHPREGKAECYARLDQGPIFALGKALREDLDHPSLAYRSPQVLQLPADSIKDIQVKKEDGGYHLRKIGTQWKITQPFDAEAMPAMANNMASLLAQLRCERYEAHQLKDPGRYGLDKPGLSIQFADSTGKQHTLAIGKPADDATGSYAHLSDQEGVLVLSEKTIAPFKRDALELLDKTLLTLRAEDIGAILVQGNTSYRLTAVKDHWNVEGSPAKTFQADEDAMKKMLRSLEVLRAVKFAAYGSNIDWAQYGLAQPVATITVAMKPEGAQTKKPVAHTIDLGKETPGGRFARIDNKKAVVILSNATAEQLNLSHLDFVNPLVLQYDADTLVGLQRQMKTGDLEIVRQEDQWRILKPFARDADNLTLGDILTKTFRLHARRIAAYPAVALKEFGLDTPYATVTLQLEIAGNPKKHVIKIGNAVKQDSDERYAMIDNDEKVVVLSSELSRHLVAPPLYYADRNLASFANIDHIRLERGPRKVVFARPEAVWQVVEPIKTEAESEALDELIRGLQRLRADEVVAEKEADRKKFGVDAPLLHWHLKSGESEKLHLIVGAAENEKPGARRFAQVGVNGEVFLLGAKLTAKVLEEYRGRKPWPALDAAQVERLTIVNGDKSFIVRKKDEQWNVVREPNLKVNVGKVVDSLDALAGLKVVRYVSDTKTDLQLYGLNAPEWKIEVQSPTGKRELWLGRTEGGSQRFYATIPGSDAVFVLSEADGARLARPLSAFIEPAKGK